MLYKTIKNPEKSTLKKDRTIHILIFGIYGDKAKEEVTEEITGNHMYKYHPGNKS
jgi:hypothetical protein